MKLIALTGKTGMGKYVKVDDQDFEEMSKYHWHMRYDGYVMRSKWIDGHKYKLRMSRILLNAPRGMVVDHINGDRLDNRRINIRICTQQQNLFNKSKSKNNKSGFKGVNWKKKDKRWRAEINLNKKNIYLGQYKDIKDAVMAYENGAKKYFGEYARGEIKL